MHKWQRGAQQAPGLCRQWGAVGDSTMPGSPRATDRLQAPQALQDKQTLTHGLLRMVLGNTLCWL